MHPFFMFVCKNKIQFFFKQDVVIVPQHDSDPSKMIQILRILSLYPRNDSEPNKIIRIPTK